MGANMNDAALLVWVKLFDGCNDVSSFGDLASGLHLAKVFSEMHPKCAIDEHELNTSSNWVLREGNVDLVVRGLEKVYKRFQTEEQVVIKDKVDNTKVAQGDEENIKCLLRFLLTSMFVSPRAEELGAQITPLTSEEETKDVPECLMAIMTEVQEEYNLDPAELNVEEEEEEQPATATRYTPTAAPLEQPHLPARPSFGVVKTAADYEKELNDLKEVLRSKEDEIANLESQNNTLREENYETNSKYQQLYDKQFAQSKNVQEETSSRASLDKLKAELESKNDTITELEKKLQGYRAKEDEWVNTSDELQIAQHDLAEAQKEAAKVDQIREQRDKAVQERNFYKNNMETLEAKLTEEIQKAAKLQSQCERAEQKAKKAEETEAEKLLVDVKLSDLENKLNEAKVALTAAASDATAAQNRIRQLSAENNSLKEELDVLQETQTAGGNLAEELTGQQGRDELLTLKKELITVKGDLEEKDDEVKRLMAKLDTVQSTVVSKEENITTLTGKVRELTHLLNDTHKLEEAEQKDTSAALLQTESSLKEKESELRVSEAKVTELETQVETLKHELEAVHAARDEALNEKVKLESELKTSGKYSSPVSSTATNAAKEKEKELKKKINDIQKQSKQQMEKMSGAFYALGSQSMQQQMTAFNKSQAPSSWLARTKHQAHSFTPKQP
eukprot:TRINITY_DN9060_c1_g1_i1.p1 TRINITY_DN9060_c1_g1~~TRINITY_DN9060_c1_g1_i1.p1  ORF type:complete len:676 (+),score=269.26 TRINITY_DN9060_c1_g1_i1:184-2211(+)